MRQTAVILLDIEVTEGESVDPAELATWLGLKLNIKPLPPGDPWHPSNLTVYQRAADLTADLKEGYAVERPIEGD